MQQLNYQHFSFRELLAQRKLAEKALKRNRDPERVGQIISRINKELDKRREIKFSNAANTIPDVVYRD
jgi:hypothetical protein